MKCRLAVLLLSARVFHSMGAEGTVAPVAGDEAKQIREQLRQVIQQNEALQRQLHKQQALIDSLTTKVNQLQDVSDQGHREVERLQSEMKGAEPARRDGLGLNLGKVNISGEGAVAFFHGGSESQFPNSEFRIDEARLFVDAPIWGDVFFYSEINLATREEPDVDLHLGEIYLDFENVSQLWNQDRMLNVRVGRMFTPFGEEYLTRYAIDNPLISHSLSDIWGTDEGLELYGHLGKVHYVAAVQNGGIPDTRDFDSDKSIAGNISYDPAPWLHLSGSGMRTGNLDVKGDSMSALWFGSAFFRSIGSAATTKFAAELFEGDVEVRLPHGHLHAFGGYVHYDDNDPAGNNRRDMYYYSVEAIHNLTRKLYAGARFSQIFANGGYPIAGQGNPGAYFYSPFAPLTHNLWRLSVGLGYRFSDNLVLKTEYSFERGEEVGGDPRDHEDMFAIEAAMKF